jgi:hypothetical protein
LKLPELFLFEHRHILFSLVGEQEEKVNCRSSWTTYWVPHQEELQGKLSGFLVHFGIIKDIEMAAEFL